MRSVALLLVILLTLLCVGLHERSTWRAQRLLDGEELARQRIEAIHRLAGNELREGGQPRLATLLAAPELSALVMLELTVAPDLAFARDQVYIYGMARSVRQGYVLRAWPVEFGITGDLQFHLDGQGHYFEGQNNKGRSGVTVDFPPPFPAPKVGSVRDGWWPREPARND